MYFPNMVDLYLTNVLNHECLGVSTINLSLGERPVCLPVVTQIAPLSDKRPS